MVVVLGRIVGPMGLGLSWMDIRWDGVSCTRKFVVKCQDAFPSFHFKVKFGLPSLLPEQ